MWQVMWFDALDSVREHGFKRFDCVVAAFVLDELSDDERRQVGARLGWG